MAVTRTVQRSICRWSPGWAWRALPVVLLLAGCGTVDQAAAPAAPQRPMIVSDPRITGEMQTATPAPDQGGAAPNPQATQRAQAVGPISFQTQTPSPTPPLDVRDTLHDPRFVQSQPSYPAAGNIPGGASIGLSNSPPTQPTPVPPPPANASSGNQAGVAPTLTPQLLPVNQALSVSLPAGTSTCDTSQTFSFNYPGDNSTVTIDAQLNGLDPSNSANAGLNVWDSTSSSAPVQTATTRTNQKNSVPGSIELTYARGIAGRVTIELYNWTGLNLTGTVTALSTGTGSTPLQVGQLRTSC